MLDKASQSVDVPVAGPETGPARQTRPTRKPIYCKNCQRKDLHYLAIHPSVLRYVIKVLSLGTIGFFGVYRCTCCGGKRIGRFDIFRGPDQPRRSGSKRQPSRDSAYRSWAWDRRRERVQRFWQRLTGRRRHREDGFKKRRHW